MGFALIKHFPACLNVVMFLPVGKCTNLVLQYISDSFHLNTLDQVVTSFQKLQKYIHGLEPEKGEEK